MQGKDEKADQETLLQGLWAPATGSAQLFSRLNLRPFRHSPGRQAGTPQGGGQDLPREGWQDWGVSEFLG